MGRKSKYTEDKSRFIDERQLDLFKGLISAIEQPEQGSISFGPARLLIDMPAGTIVGVILFETEDGKTFPLAVVPDFNLVDHSELVAENGGSASIIAGNGIQVDHTTAYGDSVVDEALRILDKEDNDG